MDESNVAASRYSRLWLVGLLALTAVVAGGALYIKYQLEGMRGVLLDSARARTGAHLDVGNITAFGLRGLRAEGVEFAYPAFAWGDLHVQAPQVVVYIDLLDLFSGKVSVEHVQLDGARFHVRRNPGIPWLKSGDAQDGRVPGSAFGGIPFRVTGSSCALTIENVVRDTRLDLGELEFDIARLPNSAMIAGGVSGSLGGDENKQISADIQFTSLKEFDLRMQCTELSAEDVNIFLPATQRIIRTGEATPTARLTGNGDGSISLSIESDFQDIQVRNQPDYLPPATGTLTAYGNYDPASQTLRLSMANANTQTLSGSLNGTVAFSDAAPQLDLTLTSTRLPVREVLNSILAGRLDSYGKVEYTVDALDACTLTLKGSTESPVVGAVAAAQGGTLSFTPADAKFPSGEVRLGRFEVVWDSETRQPSGAIPIVDGTIKHRGTGLSADGLSGRVTFEAGTVRIDPLKASFMGQPLMLSGAYNLETQGGDATVTGSLDKIEDTEFSGSIRNTTLAGGGSINATARFTPRKVEFEAGVDATQTEIGYRWWFLKPIGIGANGRVAGTFTPRKSLECEIDGLIAGTKITATTALTHDGAAWRLQHAEAASDSVDVVSVGKCLPLPYTITGGTGTNGVYAWNRDESNPKRWSSRFGCDIDRIALLAESSERPIDLKGVRMTGGMTGGETETGELTIAVEDGLTPPLRAGRWFAPLERDLEKFPPVERRWTYALQADRLEVPPWKGTGFTAEGFGTLTEFGLSRYSARVEDGQVSGSYVNQREQNAFRSEASWENIPASYMMDTLQLPHVFRGNMSGKVDYSQDRDDPGTLEGKGQFTMGEGQFSADYLLSMLEQQLESNEVSSLPPSLRFSSLEADVEFEKDIVRTPRIQLTSDAIRMEASGRFITDGDMNYEIKVAVTPDAAERIPLLADNFNVQGHRLAQQDIELAFTLSGPTFKPVSALAETPPVRVTLVSGALEAANEAFRVIDAPRKILVDLLKIGGGIVGARKPSQSGSTN